MIQDNYRISNQEIALFNSFGFLIRRNVFTPEEMAKVNEEFDHRRASVVAEIDPKEDRIITQWPTRNPETPFTASLLEDPRIYELEGLERGISRAQMEFLAARASALLGCYY